MNPCKAGPRPLPEESHWGRLVSFGVLEVKAAFSWADTLALPSLPAP